MQAFQARFHARWGHLHDAQVRALAWLLDAPGLLDPHAAPWQGHIATLGPVDTATADWLAALDQDPAPLHAALGSKPVTRLGRHAEHLLAFYLRAQGLLVAQNLQVRGTRKETVGEFDFLIRDGEDLVHWELATKFYLLQSDDNGAQAEHFVGPNLADSLGTKIRKIMESQLMLAAHPGAAAVLPQAVTRAEALVKGWLFYHREAHSEAIGIAPAHCRGFWCTLDELEQGRGALRSTGSWALLPRLSWLAPARLPNDEGLTHEAVCAQLRERFASDPEAAPVLVASLEPGAQDAGLLEADRGFVVSPGWQERAGRYLAG
ncbi:MAG TPA: DUF1853 family protein [Noviherbaspirillum sp.]